MDLSLSRLVVSDMGGDTKSHNCESPAFCIMPLISILCKDLTVGPVTMYKWLSPGQVSSVSYFLLLVLAPTLAHILIWKKKKKKIWPLRAVGSRSIPPLLCKYSSCIWGFSFATGVRSLWSSECQFFIASGSRGPMTAATLAFCILVLWFEVAGTIGLDNNIKEKFINL